MNLNQYNRSPMPHNRQTLHNPEMAQQISENPVFAAIANEVEHDRAVQAMKWNYTYVLNDTIAGQQTLPFNIQIEQGTNFKAYWLTASAFSYDTENDTDFPIPNSLGVTSWAGRGLSIRVVDTRSARELTSGYVPIELLGTPGYGLNFQHPYPFRYFFYPNTLIRFDVRNRDSADRTHAFHIALNGYKIATPE